MAGVKAAYTTKELVTMLGIATKNVIARAQRESWLADVRPGRGGGKLWLLESMPEATRQAVAVAVAGRLATLQPAPAAIAPEVFTVNTIHAVPERRRGRATARALLAGMAGEFAAVSGTARSAAYEVFCHEYNRGTIDAPAWVREILPRTCRASLASWEKALGAQGLAALAGRQGQHRKGSGVIDSTPGMADVVVAHIVSYYDVAAEEVLDRLAAKFPDRPLPGLRGLQRWMARYRAENPKSILREQNPDASRSRYQAAFGSRSADVSRINQRWELDSSPADVLLADGKRHALIGGIDVLTRRARIKVAASSNAQGVCALLRRMLIAFGVPESVKMDNGKDYTSFQVTTAIHDLNILPEYCTPFSPEEKPHIERFFGSFQRRLKTMPGFIGHSVAERKAIESRKSFAERASRKSCFAGERGPRLAPEAARSRGRIADRKQGETERPLWGELPLTPEEFQARCDAWCEEEYGERRHRALGMSPNEAAARATAHDATSRITGENIRALDILLLPIPDNGGRRRVNKDGIHVEKGLYIAPALGAHIGEDVQVRMDEDEKGYVYVFDLDGIFICRAEDPELTGAARSEIAQAARQVQKAAEKAAKKRIRKSVARLRPQELMPLVREMKAKAAAENRAERLDRFGPERALEYSTPALEQAALAARADEGPASTLSESEREAARRKAVEILTPPAAAWTIPASDADRYIECQRLAAVEKVGGEAPFEALNWMRSWKNSRAYKIFEAVRLGGEQQSN